ncbi:MAG: sugar ABC transporter ATP-binding protein [Actinomycetospora chiangmaiensis]|nr:sugar ABC transporter ATP-binding protein [Actinomycetospora chiangmaiensis]
MRPGRTPVELRLAPGEIVGLYGLVGAGRSRLLKTIWGARRANAGRVSVAGRPLPPHSIGAALGAGLAFVPEDRRAEGLVLGLSVAGNLSLPALRTFRRWPWLAWLSPGREKGFAHEIGRRLAIRFATPGQRVGTLSGGNQQKVLVGRWLRRPLSVLLLDEPTRGVDIRTKADLHAALRDLAAQGTAILFATGDLEELLDLSDRIGLLREGGWAGTLAGEERTAQAVLSRLFDTTLDAAA